MRVVYVDEKGHSSEEPVAIVAGVLLDPDRQWQLLAEQIQQLAESDVPEAHRNGFIFHAKELFHGNGYRPAWQKDHRWATLERLVAVPRKLGIPMVLGAIRKPPKRFEPHRDSLAWHGIAYSLCLKAADWFMCEKASPDEVAMVVAEERKEAREAIKEAHRLHSDIQWIERNPRLWMRSVFPIQRVKVPPAFASKVDVPFLQIADAVAFIVQRYLKERGGNSERFVAAMLGDFASPDALLKLRSRYVGYCCFWWPSEVEADAPYHIWTQPVRVPSS